MRRERPHPGAQLDLVETRDGWRYTCFVTDTRAGQFAFLDARHRAHACVEDGILPHRQRHRDRSLPIADLPGQPGWLALMLAVDLLAWAQHLLLNGELACAEPKTLRYRLLRVAAQISRAQRRAWVRIQAWPWARELAAAVAHLRAMPGPAG